MLNDDEAVAVVLGLIGTGGPVDGALAKILRVLPAPLRAQVEALEQSLGFTAEPSGAPVGGGVALALADAIHRRRRVRFAYRSFSGEATQRDVSPHGLVVHAGRWYLAAHDHVRVDLRTFRVDRVSSLSVSREHAAAPPADFDAVAYVSRSLARVPWRWEVEVLLDLPLDEAATRLPATLAELAPAGPQTLLRMRVNSLDWMAGVLAGLDCSFEVRTPPELTSERRALSERLSRLQLESALRVLGPGDQREQGEQAPGCAGDAVRVVEGEAHSRHAFLARFARVHDAHVGARQQDSQGVAHLEAAARAQRGRRAFEQQADAVDREVVREAEDLAIVAEQQAAPGDEHEAHHAASIAGARDDPLPRDGELGFQVVGTHDARAQLVQLAADAPADDGAIADLRGEPAGGLQDERALVAAGHDGGQRLADVDGEGDEGSDSEGHLLFGDDGCLGHAHSRSAEIAETASPVGM